MELRIGQGYDVHALAEGLPMWLCGIKLDSSLGFVAHSDGDVAIHALCDALLGCRAMGDIGHLFPDSSEEWKGVDSKLLLDIVCKKVCSDGWTIANIDITIALQSPKLAPHIEKMRATLSDVMNIPQDCVSIKATTTEKLGFVGRKEGCEVWAIALLQRARK